MFYPNAYGQGPTRNNTRKLKMASDLFAACSKDFD